MPIQRISIDQSFASIGLNITKAGLNINMPRGQLTIQKQDTQLQVDTQMPTFQMDRKAFTEMNLKSHLEFAREFSAQGKQAAIQAIGQFKSDGNFLGELRNQGDRVSQLAANKSNARLGRKDFNIGLMPRSTPELHWQQGYININWTKPDLQIDYNGGNTAEVSLNPRHSVEVYLQERGHFSVTVMEAGNGTPLYA